MLTYFQTYFHHTSNTYIEIDPIQTQGDKGGGGGLLKTKQKTKDKYI